MYVNMQNLSKACVKKTQFKIFLENTVQKIHCN